MSVAIPVYNHARYLEACLDSVRDEGYPEIEVLVLDDGSTDESSAVAERWRERNPQAFRGFRLWRQSNSGICATLNRLVAMAAGEFVAPVASDDCLLPGGLRVRVQALRRRADWLAVFADSIVIDENGQLIALSGLVDRFHASKYALRKDALRAHEIVLRWSVPGPVFLARREAYDPARGVGPYDETLAIEDRDFYLRLIARNALGFVDRPVGAYRRHSTNTTARSDVRLRNALSIRESVLRHTQDFSGIARLALRLQAQVAAAAIEHAQGRRGSLWKGRACRWLRRVLIGLHDCRIALRRWADARSSPEEGSPPDERGTAP